MRISDALKNTTTVPGLEALIAETTTAAIDTAEQTAAARGWAVGSVSQRLGPSPRLSRRHRFLLPASPVLSGDGVEAGSSAVPGALGASRGPASVNVPAVLRSVHGPGGQLGECPQQPREPAADLLRRGGQYRPGAPVRKPDVSWKRPNRRDQPCETLSSCSTACA